MKIKRIAILSLTLMMLVSIFSFPASAATVTLSTDELYDYTETRSGYLGYTTITNYSSSPNVSNTNCYTERKFTICPIEKLQVRVLAITIFLNHLDLQPGILKGK